IALHVLDLPNMTRPYGTNVRSSSIGRIWTCLHHRKVTTGVAARLFDDRVRRELGPSFEEILSRLIGWTDLQEPRTAICLLEPARARQASENFVERHDLTGAGLKRNLSNQVVGKPNRTFTGCSQRLSGDRRRLDDDPP